MRIKHTVRSSLYPTLDEPIEDTIDGSGSQYRVSKDEFVAHADADLEQVIQWLNNLGFRYEIFAALKLDTNSNSDDGSFVYRKWRFAPYQAHVHLWERDSGVTIAAHREYSITRPIKHYYGEYYSPTDGVSWVSERLEQDPPRWDYETATNTL